MQSEENKSKEQSEGTSLLTPHEFGHKKKKQQKKTCQGVKGQTRGQLVGDCRKATKQHLFHFFGGCHLNLNALHIFFFFATHVLLLSDTLRCLGDERLIERPWLRSPTCFLADQSFSSRPISFSLNIKWLIRPNTRHCLAPQCRSFKMLLCGEGVGGRMGDGIHGHSTLNTQDHAQFNNHSGNFYSFIYVYHFMQLQFMWVFSFIYEFYCIICYFIHLYLCIFLFFSRDFPSDRFKLDCHQLSGSLIFYFLTLCTWISQWIHCDEPELMSLTKKKK